MKNIINYYYNLLIDDYKKKDNKFIFELDNIEYEFFAFNGDLNKLIHIYTKLIANKLYCHEIIVNKQNSIVTIYDNESYILIKKNINIDKNITFDDIFKYDIYLMEQNKILWKQLWIDKIDYYEYQMNQIGIKYNVLKESFNYYIGMCENAIQLLNYVVDDVKIYVCHNRIHYNESLNNFFNPTNIILDNITRDISEYIKFGFMINDFNEIEILNCLYQTNLQRDEYILLFARLLYPSYYFDEYDNIIKNNESDTKIKNIIKKSIYYEILLKKIYNLIKTKCNFPRIEWLEIKQY